MREDGGSERPIRDGLIFGMLLGGAWLVSKHFGWLEEEPKRKRQARAKKPIPLNQKKYGPYPDPWDLKDVT